MLSPYQKQVFTTKFKQLHEYRCEDFRKGRTDTMVRKLSASHVSQPAASRRDWGPVEAARYQFELLKLLSTDRRVEATARRMGLYGAEALPSRPRQPTKERTSSKGVDHDEAGT